MKKFTSEELTYFETELCKFKSPWITKLVIKSWFLFGRYSIFPIFVLIIAGMILYFQYIPVSGIWRTAIETLIMWSGFILIFYFGFFFISHLLLEWKIRVTRRQLGLSVEEWNYLIDLFKIKI